MKKTILAAAAMAGIWAVQAQADVPGKDWISHARVIKMLETKGYQVTKIEADDGHWEGEAVRNHQHFDFHVDPHSGQITKMERDND
ncbi:PepSY domain-containing protein [Novosphingobium sp. 9]|uniref:PepSY domain-containing protein n=1 Tax=Novosphingobium sp. 9 TaxID=2025349 RepID=UPI0021B62B52|nr:PepSY domain-containing protein [Novosphingobium sp. 9]